jgi:hypothetical protein
MEDVSLVAAQLANLSLLFKFLSANNARVHLLAFLANRAVQFLVLVDSLYRSIGPRYPVKSISDYSTQRALIAKAHKAAHYTRKASYNPANHPAVDRIAPVYDEENDAYDPPVLYFCIL